MEKFLKVLNVAYWVFLFLAMLGFVTGFMNDPDNLGYRIIFIVGIIGFAITFATQFVIKKWFLGSKKDGD